MWLSVNLHTPADTQLLHFVSPAAMSWQNTAPPPRWIPTLDAAFVNYSLSEANFIVPFNCYQNKSPNSLKAFMFGVFACIFK